MKKSNMEIEWETIYPEIAKILVGPSHYLIEAHIITKEKFEIYF